MPKALERKFAAQARKIIKGRSKDAKRRRAAYTYGTLRKTGWSPGR